MPAASVCNPNDLLAAGSCFACKTSDELEILKTILLAKILQNLDPMASIDPNTLLASGSCFACLPPNILQIIQTILLCSIFNSGSAGGGGGGGALCGVVDPSTAPTGSCSLYVNTATGSLWYWDAGSASWIALIAG